MLLTIFTIGVLLLGFSSGLGFWPIYKQPKNFKIQLTLALIGLLMCVPTFLILIKIH